MAYTGSNARRGAGSLLKVKVGSPLAFATIPEVTDAPMNPGEPDEYETTNMESSAKEYLYGLANRGTIPVKGNYDPANAVLQALQVAGAAGSVLDAEYWFPQYPAPVKFAFKVVCGPFNINPNLKGVVEYSQNLKITGDVTGPTAIS